MRTLVDQYVVVEGHIVDLIVGREGKCLRADLHTDRLTLRFRVNVSFIVKDPVEVAVTVERDQVLTLSLLAVNLLQEIVPRVVARGGVVESVSVVIEEGREVEILVQRRVAVRRVIKEVRRDAVSVRELLLEVAFGVAYAVKVLAVALRVRSRGDEEVIVRVKLDQDDVINGNLENLRLVGPKNNVAMLSEIAVIENKIPFSSISRQDGFREVTISGDLNSSLVNTTQARNFLLQNGLVELAKKYNLDYRFAGKDLEQKETFADMFIGSIIGLIIIYIVLTWVFKSWLRPFTIMIMIPLSFIGAVFGHYFLNLTMSILSMFALLALAGIVVNNSIILVSTIERRLDELIKGNTINLEIFKQAVISGVINRLRPVLLTSLTTIGGLSALMFEKSLQAQFLIPLAATIVFGLGITAILVLIVIPSMMGIGKDLSLLIKGSKIN